jgi:thiamine biosynthesis lipoprotein
MTKHIDSFPCMGNTANIVVIGEQHLLHTARSRLADLENKWSRFIDTSEISLINNADGKEMYVSADTVALVRYLVDAQSRTHGLFDPSLLPALIGLGYGVSRTDSSMKSEIAPNAQWAIPLGETRIDQASGAVRLPSGATLDPGGLGKGLAADIVAGELISFGAAGVCVSIGGDMRIAGESELNGGWSVAVESPFDESADLATLVLNSGGIATSSTRGKRWVGPLGEMHHVLNPITATPLTEFVGQLVQSTVLASEAVWAEVFATALLVGGLEQGMPLIDQLGMAAMAVTVDGDIIESSTWKEFVS